MEINKDNLIRILHNYDSCFYIKDNNLSDIIKIIMCKDYTPDGHDYIFMLHDIAVDRNMYDYIDTVFAYSEVDFLSLIMYLLEFGNINYDIK